MKKERIGSKRTNADKRRAVLDLLAIETSAGWSDRRLAAVANVSPKLVSKLRSPGRRPETLNLGEPLLITKVFRRHPGLEPPRRNVLSVFYRAEN
jgi:hypothetical protein